MAMEDWMMNECYLWSSTVDETATNNMKCGYLYLSESLGQTSICLRLVWQ